MTSTSARLPFEDTWDEFEEDGEVPDAEATESADPSPDSLSLLADMPVGEWVTVEKNKLTIGPLNDLMNRGLIFQRQGQYQRPHPDTPMCDHGPMEYREHEGKRGYVCLLPLGEPDRCESIVLGDVVSQNEDDLPFFGTSAWDHAQERTKRSQAETKARRSQAPVVSPDDELPWADAPAGEPLPFADEPEVEVEVEEPKPRVEVEEPKPQAEAPKAVEKVSEPFEATQVELAGTFGLKERREWLNKVSKAFKGQHRIFHVATSYAFRAHGRDRTVYSGSALLAEETDIAERHIKTERSRLVDAGFLVDTGERKGRAIVYRLA